MNGRISVTLVVVPLHSFSFASFTKAITANEPDTLFGREREEKKNIPQTQTRQAVKNRVRKKQTNVSVRRYHCQDMKDGSIIEPKKEREKEGDRTILLTS
jgi:hypothetical protein